MAQVEAVAGSGAACACLVRALATRVDGGEPVAQRLAAASQAWQRGRNAAVSVVPRWPQPSLDPPST